MSEWLPIESAPKDGTRVLVAYYGPTKAAVKKYSVAEAVWCAGGWGDPAYWEWDLDGYNVTHWMPLPEPPSLRNSDDPEELGSDSANATSGS